MANEQTGGEPLSATIAEQLQEKQQVEAQATEGRAATEREEQRTERRKAEDRADVLRHVEPESASPEGWRARRARARERGLTSSSLRDWTGALLPAAGAALIALGLVTGRRRQALLGVPLLAGLLVLRRRLPAR